MKGKREGDAVSRDWEMTMLVNSMRISVQMMVMSMFHGMIGKYPGDGLRVREVAEAGNRTQGLKEYAEGGTSGIMVGAASADILWSWRRHLLHLRCQREMWVVCEWAGGEQDGVLLVLMESSLMLHSS